jgi:hypothetical protein
MAAIGTRNLTLSIDGDDVTAEVSTATITSADSPRPTSSASPMLLPAVRASTAQPQVHSGRDEHQLVESGVGARRRRHRVIVRPYGNTAASATQPFFEGTVTITEPDGDPARRRR